METPSRGVSKGGTKDSDSKFGYSIGLKWDKWRLLSSQLYTSHGTPTVCTTSDKWIIVGTQSAEVLVFDWNQKLIVILRPPQGTYGSVTCVGSDNSRVIAGFATGYVLSWDLDGTLVLFAAPLPSSPPENTTENHLDGHVQGSKITWVALANKTAYSSDSHGLVFEHHNIRLLRRVRSQRLLGRHSSGGCVLAALRIVLGDNEVLSILTPQALFIYSAGIQFMLPRAAEYIDTSMGLSGALAWHPPTQSLVACWARSLRVMRVREQSTKLECTTERLWTCEETIVGVSFLNSRTLAILTVTENLLILDIESLAVLTEVAISSQHPVHMDLFSAAMRDSENPVVADAYSLNTHGLSILILGKYEFHCATFVNWADKLMQHLKSSEPITAVRLAVTYYLQDTNLELLGLDTSNCEVVAAALPDIILASLRYATSFDAGSVDKLLDACLDAVIATGAELVQPIYDLLEDSEYELLYLHKLQVLALDGKISYLPPNVFRQIFKHLADNELFVFKDLLLKLDISSLDVNLAFDVCRQYNLKDIELFLYGAVLEDFVSPLIDPCEESYTFLSYSVSGRVYPTAAPMRPELRAKACHDIYFFMVEDQRFRNLLILDPVKFFEVLNETFEQSFLNEEEFSRQTLMPIVRQLCGPEFKQEFNIFLALNATKYPQFLVFTGTELTVTFKELCLSPTSQKGLAASYLLPVLQMDVDEVICLLSEASYWSTLETLYISRKRWLDLTKTLLKNEENTPEFWPRLVLGLQDPKSSPLVVAASATLAERDPEGFARFVDKHQLSGVFEHIFDIPENARIEFLSAVHISLPSSVLLELLRLVLENRASATLDIVQTMDYSDAAVALLEKHKQYGALMQFYSVNHKPREAMQVLLQHFDAEYMPQGVELCLRAADTDLEQAKELWVQFLVAAVQHKQSLEGPLVRLLQWSLDKKLDTSVIQRTHSTDLARLYLDTINKQLLFVDAARRLTGVSTLKLAEIAGRQLKGWTFCADGDCETCGERLSGLGVLADKLYAEWEIRRKNGDIQGDRLVLFQCTHIYHEKCLLKYGGLECAICK